jgi:hypothetical protein
MDRQNKNLREDHNVKTGKHKNEALG